MHPDEPTRRELLVRVGPFGAIGALALLLSILGAQAGFARLLVVAAALLLAVVPVAIVLVPWDRLGQVAPLLPVGAFCLAVALLRHAAGGADAGYAPLVLLPIAWEALYGTRRELTCTTVMVGLTLAVPIVALGGSSYPDRQWRYVLLFTVTGAVIGNVIHELVNERRELFERLRRQALEDDLTGLANRRACEALLEAAATASADWCLSFVDMDQFKAFNDAHGHEAGDHLLRDAARVWAGALGAPDHLGRWGGEEFVVITEGGIDRALAVLERFAAVTPAGQTFSAGAALMPAGSDWRTALAAADGAMYRAKRAGRQRVEVAIAVSAPRGRGSGDPDRAPRASTTMARAARA